VISPKFGDIFRNNATKAGLVPVQVDDEFGAALLEAAEEHPFLEVIVDVETKTVSVPRLGMQASFPLDDFTQHRILNGLDDIGLTMTHEDDVAAYEQTRKPWLPQVDAPEPVTT
jgi:3-isopropylmalate/(R)-2-methylmalate dehydratase small subunit